MASSKTESKVLKDQTNQAMVEAEDGKVHTGDTLLDEPGEDSVVQNAIVAIEQYLMDNAPVYQELQQLRAKVSDFRVRKAPFASCQEPVAFLILTTICTRDGKTQRVIYSSRGSNVGPMRTARRRSSASTT